MSLPSRDKVLPSSSARGPTPRKRVSNAMCGWERDLVTWDVDDETVAMLAELEETRPDIAMAYCELLNPETFEQVCGQIQAHVNVRDVGDVEDAVVGMLSHILYNLITKPEEYHFDEPNAARKFLHGAIRNTVKKLIADSYSPVVNCGYLAEMSSLEMTQQAEYFDLELQELLDLLPIEQATVLALYVRGYQLAEIAETLDIPLGTAKSRLHRARRTLAKWLHL